VENTFELKIDEEEILSDYVSEQNQKFFTLHEWQKKAIDYFFTHGCKAIFEVTTGAGKSICAIDILKEVIRKNPNIYILIVVPKNVILEKMWFPELMKHGFSMKDIGVFYGGNKECCKITITNMQNISQLPIDIFSMIILDEIHNYCTPRLLKILKHPFQYKLGLSATLERIDKNHWEMLSFFHYHVFKYTPKEALEDGVLNNFNFINVGIVMDSEDYDKYLDVSQQINVCLKQGGSFNRVMSGKAGIGLKNQFLKLIGERKQMVLNYYLKFDVVKKLVKNHLTNKILIFNEYNKSTTKCYWALLEDKIKARILHSGVPKDERENILNDYQSNKFNILLATKILDEGYNLPSIDVGIIMAGNSTAKQTIQRLGRVLRKKEKISTLYQIFIKHTMEEDNANERSKIFKELCTEFKEYKVVEGKIKEV
jgi:RNA polymerase primary sigma factor